METKKLELRPQKGTSQRPRTLVCPQKESTINLQKKEQKNTTNTNLSNIVFDEKLYLDTPEHVIMEWELFEIIVSFLGIVFYEPSEDYGCQYFTSSGIKQFYKEITYQDFDKLYGINGLDTLLSFRSGIKYDNLNNIWYVYPHKFMIQLRNDYAKNEDIYGIDFYKPWRRNIENNL